MKKLENLNKRLIIAEELHSSINNEIEFLRKQIDIFNARLVKNKSKLADAQYKVTRIIKEKEKIFFPDVNSKDIK